jgi:hypothetical protein
MRSFYCTEVLVSNTAEIFGVVTVALWLVLTRGRCATVADIGGVTSVCPPSLDLRDIKQMQTPTSISAYIENKHFCDCPGHLRMLLHARLCPKHPSRFDLTQVSDS